MPNILAFINKCVPEIFGTMVGIQVSPGDGADDAPRPSVLDGVTGSVSLTGKVDGVVYTAFSERLAMHVAERILGAGCNGESEVTDVVGELTNMITGNLKSQLTDMGYNCQLSIPTVMRGGHISVVAKDAPLSVRNTYSIADLGETLTVQVFARIDK
jgi:chemotaxis protein CheX